MKRTLTIAASVFLIGTLAAGCYNDNVEDMYPGGAGNCGLDSVTFSRTIQPIMNQSCALGGCHDAASAMAGVNLTTHAGAQAVALNGRLVGTTTHAAGFSQMPKGGSKLDDCKLSQIQKWVSNGAPNN